MKEGVEYMNNTTHGIGLSSSPYVKFVRATPDSFKKLTLKDGNTLYFVSNIDVKVYIATLFCELLLEFIVFETY